MALLNQQQPSESKMNAMAPIAAHVKQEVDKILNGQEPVLVRVKQLFKCLQEHGLAYVQHVLPKDTLTHPSNRGGSLLSISDVWAKGKKCCK